MRKLLILVMIIGFAGAASAALQIDIYDGTAAYVDEGQAVNDTLELRIKGVSFGTSEMCYFGLVCDTDDGTVAGGSTNTDNAPSISAIGNYPAYYYLPYLGLAVDEDGAAGTIGEGSTLTGPWSGDFFEGITFTMKKSEVGTVTVKLYATTDDYTTSNVLATATIKSIPEPMTMALLGLGALFLRRRRS